MTEVGVLKVSSSGFPFLGRDRIVPPKLVYRNSVYLVLGAFLLLGMVIFIAQALSPGKGGVGLQVLDAVFAAAAVSLSARTLIAPSITAAPNGVWVRTLLGTRKYGWDEIERFQARKGKVGAYRRKVLGIALRDGKVTWFTALNDQPEGTGWVDEAVLKMNSYLSSRQPRAADMA